MLQNLLAERFHWKTHAETREGTIYGLSLSKAGVIDLSPRTGRAVAIFRSHQARIRGRAAPLSELTRFLERALETPVHDATGLTSTYDFHLAFDPNQSTSAPPSNPNAPRAAAREAAITLPLLPAALETELGLHLKRKRGQAEYLIIDSIDPAPSAN